MPVGVALPIRQAASRERLPSFYVQHQFEETHWAKGKPGTCIRQPSTAAHTMLLPPFSGGSPRTSACVMCIICQAAIFEIASKATTTAVAPAVLRVFAFLMQ